MHSLLLLRCRLYSVSIAVIAVQGRHRLIMHSRETADSALSRSVLFSNDRYSTAIIVPLTFIFQDPAPFEQLPEVFARYADELFSIPRASPYLASSAEIRLLCIPLHFNSSLCVAFFRPLIFSSSHFEIVRMFTPKTLSGRGAMIKLSRCVHYAIVYFLLRVISSREGINLFCYCRGNCSFITETCPYSRTCNFTLPPILYILLLFKKFTLLSMKKFINL